MRALGPGHRDGGGLANKAASPLSLLSHRGVGLSAPSWQVGSGTVAAVARSAVRRSSGGPHPSPNPRLQRTPSAPLSRQPLGARKSIVALFALALTPVLLGAESGDLCGRFPEAGFDGPEMRHFAGAYTNPNYGYSVLIPKGLTGYDVPAPSPHHGVGIVLSWEPRAYISVDGSYLTEEMTLAEVADQHLDFLRGWSQAVLTTRRSTLRLGGLRAQRVISEHTCRSVPGVFVQDAVVAVSGNIFFTLELLTSKQRYAADRQVLDRMLSTWHVAKISALAPNPRLQRTPSAPLSRQPLGSASYSGE